MVSIQRKIENVAFNDDSMTIAIALSSDCINHLDLSPATTVIDKLLQEGTIASYEQQVRFEIDFPLDPTDPRELSEIPEIRLWFIRLDVRYPWLLFLLDWKSGELARFTAMLVPHQFNRTEGIQYNPEALEIFVMQKIFVLTNWLREQGIPNQSRSQSMAQMLGYELDSAFFDLIQ
ncbi:MAG TPA: CRR6 family NdhI maturation factor [Waterburya sp.]